MPVALTVLVREQNQGQNREKPTSRICVIVLTAVLELVLGTDIGPAYAASMVATQEFNMRRLTAAPSWVVTGAARTLTKISMTTRMMEACVKSGIRYNEHQGITQSIALGHLDWLQDSGAIHNLRKRVRNHILHGE